MVALTRIYAMTGISIRRARINETAAIAALVCRCKLVRNFFFKDLQCWQKHKTQ